jgi:hypothetical protein
MTDSRALERTYRRVLACYPRSFRRDNEDEILAVLIAAAAEEGRTRVGLAEAADLIRGAVRMRLWPAAPRPGAVRAAVRLMWAGAAAELAVLLTLVLTMGRVHAAVMARYPGAWHPTLVRLDLDMTLAPVIIGLWLWQASANGRGRDLARVLAAAAFLALTLSLLLTVAQDAVVFAPADVAAAAVEWALGLASVVFVFTPASCRYFRPPAAAARR